MPDSVQTVRRAGEHSEKPELFRQIIEQLYTRGPYLELFGRRRVEGWSVFGNDARLWAKEAARHDNVSSGKQGAGLLGVSKRSA